MALGVTQAAKRMYPAWDCVFHSRHFTLLENAPGLHRVVEFAPASDDERFEFTYAHKTPYSLNRQMAMQIGLDLPDYAIELPRIPEAHWLVRELCGQVTLVIQTDSSGWTSNKDWPNNYWQALVESLPSEWAVLEVGRESVFQEQPKHAGFHSFSGKTSLLEYVALIQNADAFVGSPSGGMHVAHAYRRPSVIVIGGYEAAHYPYPLSRQLGTEVSCAPCWLREPCPYQKKCLLQITPKQVHEALMLQMNNPAI